MLNIGDACDDGDAGTYDDTVDANCVCAGTPYDCPNLMANIGDACDDMDPNTSGDVVDANCVCAGSSVFDCPNLGANIGDACDDGDAGTYDDTVDANCVCAGTPYDCPNLMANIGDACDDMDPNTTGDVVNANCVCVGTPVGGCTETLTLEITLDDFGSETTWELYDDTGLNLIDMGGPYQDGMAGTVVTETLCLDQTCYRLVVNDDGGNGITDGGYVLTDANGRRIVDANGLFGSTSSVTYPFCLPLSNQGMINAFCDRMDLTYASSTQFYAHYQPGASGYQWWIFDPHGTYSRRVYRTTQNLIPTYLVTLPVPADLDLNVRVRALIGGNYTDFGPACRVRLNSPIGQRNLIDLPNGAALSVYPNPNRTGLLFVDLDQLGEGMHHVQIDLYNAMGQQVYAQQLSTEGDKLQQQLQLDRGMAAGLYTIIVTADGSQLSDRVVIE
ncbi:MAG: T9SS type A sorting domain-containing protein [Flavobacteriales bacterium]|nr:T9SS type A sorting domain-containing protein [Flavobacteriales bacterium]